MLFFHRTPASSCAQDGRLSLNDSYSVLLGDHLPSLWHMTYLLYVIHNTTVKTDLLIYFSCHSSISQLFCNILRLGSYWAQSQIHLQCCMSCRFPSVPVISCHAHISLLSPILQLLNPISYLFS